MLDCLLQQVLYFFLLTFYFYSLGRKMSVNDSSYQQVSNYDLNIEDNYTPTEGDKSEGTKKTCGKFIFIFI